MQKFAAVCEPPRRLARLTQNRETPVRRTQEERTLVERAKELLMAQSGVTEAQAHRMLQKRSMDRGARLADTARKVLEELSPGRKGGGSGGASSASRGEARPPEAGGRVPRSV
ncbi:MAG: ANTAR domain-containing protein [Oscillospiraceae bacterium]|nr:ANTAR domain-containing protein [Oscillospiraceae bacterium]